MSHKTVIICKCSVEGHTDTLIKLSTEPEIVCNIRLVFRSDHSLLFEEMGAGCFFFWKPELLTNHRAPYLVTTDSL